jgi:hypothetical protein
MVVILAYLLTSSTKQGYYVQTDKGRMRMKKTPVAIIAGLFLLTLILPQLALADGPGISDVSATVINPSTAIITWTTNSSSDSLVNYDTSPGPLLQHASDNSSVISHSIKLENLTPDTMYYYEVYSGGERSPAEASAYYSFKTSLPPVGYYSITLNPVCGVCGELIEVGICGEVIGVTAIVSIPGTYHICWDSLTNVKETFTADTAGSYSLVIYTPEATKGDHTVYLVDNTYAQKASAIFTVLPSVKIDPTEGPAGTNVILNGYGFTASQPLQIKFKDTVIQTPTANSVGSWTVNYTTPATPAGGYIFEIQAKEGTVWVGWVSKYFKVTPQITATPSSGTVGQTVAIKGTGFASKEKDIEVTFGGKMVKKISYAEENGSWSDIIAVPPVQRGDYKIDASGTSTRARDVPDVTFTVNPGILVEPISAYIGDTITVAGGGFALGETGIRVYFDGMVVSSTTITADASGCWQSSFTLPVSTYGSHTVSASGDITQPAVTNTLNTQARILEISPVEGAPGDPVSLTGDGFGGDKKLTVTIGGTAVSGNNLNTQFNGNVVISFRVPKGSTEGQRTLVVTDGGGATASVDFTVTKKTLSTTPLPISPENEGKLRSGEVTFKWQGATGSTGYTYTLEISQTAGGGSIWSKSGITGSSYTLTDTETVTETLPKGTYYWRVKIVDDYGNEGPWSDSIKFMVSPIPTWVWVVVGLVVLIVLMVVAYRETKFKVTE